MYVCHVCTHVLYVHYKCTCTHVCILCTCTRRIIYFFKHVEFLLSQESVSQENLHFFFPNTSETRLNLLFLKWCCFQVVGDGLTVNRHCFLFCFYFFNIFQENLRFFFPLVVSIFFFFFDVGLGFWSGCSSLAPSLLSLSYLEICSMVPSPPQFLPPPLFFEICSFVSGGTRWMEEEE